MFSYMAHSTHFRVVVVLLFIALSVLHFSDKFGDIECKEFLCGKTNLIFSSRFYVAPAYPSILY